MSDISEILISEILKMKQEAKLRIVSLIVMLCIIAHFLYYSQKVDFSLPLYLLFIGGWAPSTLLYAILPPKKIRTPSYSKIFSFVGIFVSLCSFVIYFSCFLGTWLNDNLIFFIFLIAAGYSIFLSWYKNGWWGWHFFNFSESPFQTLYFVFHELSWTFQSFTFPPVVHFFNFSAKPF